MGDNEQEAYAAASLRERLRDVDLTESKEAYAHAGLVQDERKRQVLNQLALAAEDAEGVVDVTETRAYQDLLKPAGTETITHAVAEGSVSQMQYAVGLVNHSKEGAECLIRFARSLKREGAIGLVVGSPNSGKTASLMDAARIWKALTGGTVVSNIGDWDGTDVVAYSDEALLEAMAETDGQVLGLIDEAAQELTSRGEDQQRTNHLAKRLKKVRKKEDGESYAKQGSIAMVGHTKSDTAKEFRRLATAVLEKPSVEDPGKAILYDSPGSEDSLEEIDSYEGITDTAETYDEHDPSPFRIMMPDDPDGEDGPDPEDVDRDRQVETALRACLVRGMSYPEAEELIDYGDTWVGDRVREWRAGDWRDLVEESEVPAEYATA